MIKTIRLTKENIPDLIKLSQQDDFPFKLNEKMLKEYCKGEDPIKMCVQTYGVYDDEKLIAVMTASYLNVFFHKDSPHGKTVQISGAYVIPERRSEGFGTMLLEAIKTDAKEYFKADYLCCDTYAPDFFFKNSFIISSEDRMWIMI